LSEKRRNAACMKEVVRWVVERAFAWLAKCRGILVRYDKKDGNYLGLIQLPCGLLWYHRLHRTGRCDATENTT
jgi:transposase